MPFLMQNGELVTCQVLSHWVLVRCNSTSSSVCISTSPSLPTRTKRCAPQSNWICKLPVPEGHACGGNGGSWKAQCTAREFRSCRWTEEQTAQATKDAAPSKMQPEDMQLQQSRAPRVLRANEMAFFYKFRSDETHGHTLLLGQVAGDTSGQGVLTNVK